ncbi:MAG: glycosyltransferase family 2 protein [Clostridia bacterium]|nr:glycosyltransferase family 2 protein [Clostridia bacterium]
MMRISFIIVAYNAASSIGALLEDLLAQTILPEQIEALLVDSASTDETRALMQAFAKTAPFEVKVLDNPRRWLASGINVALAAASGDAIIRLDAHARIPKDFLQHNLNALARGEDIVGGCVAGGEPRGAWESVLRTVDTSRFCGGAAPFRNGGEARYVDTLAYALYRREVYDTVGLYDERLRRTEDNDMHYRMHKAGYKFYFSPDIISYHAARSTMRGQLKQKWGNGYWIGRTMRIQPCCFAPRHLVPAAFVLALFGALALLPVSAWPLALLLFAYLTCDLFFAARGAASQQEGRLLALVSLPLLFPAVHIVYGTGTICGLLSAGKEKRHAEMG